MDNTPEFPERPRWTSSDSFSVSRIVDLVEQQETLLNKLFTAGLNYNKKRRELEESRTLLVDLIQSANDVDLTIKQICKAAGLTRAFVRNILD